LRRLLRSAERRSEFATCLGDECLKTSGSRSSALLVRVTCCDHFFPARGFVAAARSCRLRLGC